MRKGLAAVILFHSLALGLASCARPDSSQVVDLPAFRVAVLTPGPISDQGWNASAYAGLALMRDSLAAEISHVQTKTPAEFEENFRQYGARGFQLVIGHGFEFQQAAQRVGPEFPKTIYVTTGGTGTGPNIAAISFGFDEPSFLAGIAAAGVSRSGVIGAIGGTEMPPVKSAFDAFAAGARSVRPDVRVLIAYLGSWEDAGAGKEQALAQIARGADVIFQNADAAGLGIFQAVRESKGAWIIGANADQNAIAPQSTLGSVVIDVPLAFLHVAREVKRGHFFPRVIRFGTPSNVVRWVPNPAVSPIPETTRTRIDSVLTAMREARFTLPAATTR